MRIPGTTIGALKLKNRDLIPYIGSASKVSEVLSGRRSLSITMIRNLVQGLGIPAQVLIGNPGAKLDPNDTVAACSFARST